MVSLPPSLSLSLSDAVCLLFHLVPLLCSMIGAIPVTLVSVSLSLWLSLSLSDVVCLLFLLVPLLRSLIGAIPVTMVSLSLSLSLSLAQFVCYFSWCHCYVLCGQRWPRSDCASAQSDQDLQRPLTEILDTTECINVGQWSG